MRSETGKNLQVPGRSPINKIGAGSCARELTQTCGMRSRSHMKHMIFILATMACTCATDRRPQPSCCSTSLLCRVGAGSRRALRFRPMIALRSCLNLSTKTIILTSLQTLPASCGRTCQNESHIDGPRTFFALELRVKQQASTPDFLPSRRQSKTPVCSEARLAKICSQQRLSKFQVLQQALQGLR